MESVRLAGGGGGMLLDSVKVPLVPSCLQYRSTTFCLFMTQCSVAEYRHACPHFYIPPTRNSTFSIYTPHWALPLFLRLQDILRSDWTTSWFSLVACLRAKSLIKLQTLHDTFYSGDTSYDDVTSILKQDSNLVLPCMQVMSLRFYHAWWQLNDTISIITVAWILWK
jgi:hypothetical protein